MGGTLLFRLWMSKTAMCVWIATACTAMVWQLLLPVLGCGQTLRLTPAPVVVLPCMQLMASTHWMPSAA